MQGVHRGPGWPAALRGRKPMTMATGADPLCAWRSRIDHGWSALSMPQPTLAVTHTTRAQPTEVTPGWQQGRGDRRLREKLARKEPSATRVDRRRWARSGGASEQPTGAQTALFLDQAGAVLGGGLYDPEAVHDRLRQFALAGEMRPATAAQGRH